jgi:hypothetical protein
MLWVAVLRLLELLRYELVVPCGELDRRCSVGLVSPVVLQLVVLVLVLLVLG